ncbi:MAG: hypothetical protein ACKVHN_06820 [Candidatus Poseidoniales archaeon]|jgi:DNA-binding MarR family transcriptional regulator|tara:strand:+ start:2361 stop:3371 length:1011 start_codon:yes stop_codon:yes gene_type:complete
MWLWRAGLLVSFVAVVLLAPNVYSQLSPTNYLNSEASAGETMLDDLSFNAQPTNDSSSQESSQDSEQQSESGEDESSTASSEEEDQSKSSDDSAESSNSDSPPSESASFAADETGQASLQQANDNSPTYSKFDLSDDNLKLGGASLATSFIISSAGFALLLEGVKISMIIALFGPLLAKKHSGESGTLSKGRILGYIEAHPGIHFSALRDGLSLANGATSHHLHNLEREGKIISWSDGRRTRYAIPSIDPTTLNTLKHPATAVQKSILNALENNFDDGLSSTELRNRLECTRQLLAYHLGSLSGRQFIERNGKGRKTIWQISIKGQQHMEILQKTG